MTFEKDMAEKMILPILQKIYTKALSEDNPIKNKSDLKNRFIADQEINVSSAKFDKWLADLNIKFKKVVVIEGLVPDMTHAPSPAQPSGRAVEEDDVTFDDEDPRDFLPPRNNLDMFNQINP